MFGSRVTYASCSLKPLSSSFLDTLKGFDIAAMAAAAEKHRERKLKEQAEGYVKMGKAAFDGAKDAASELGVGF